MNVHDPLALFLPPVRDWFRASLGEPTPVQRDGWPVIASGQNALLLAPTGSGKTLAAFLACLDGLWRQTQLERGVRVLYISPLKALNNDIYRNLQLPLRGVVALAESQALTLPTIDIAVRTGDTSTAERQRLIRKPPHILITTPESLHLLLTSKARETLRGVTHCIVDEIHALCPNKRGVFLSLLLERLQAINPRAFARIGLSATQRPLEEVARYLGGFEETHGQRRERPVVIVDAGLRKSLELRVVSPVEQFGPLAEKTIWPSIYRRLASEIREHRSTIVFANNRRSVERLTSQLNECLNDTPSNEKEETEASTQVRAHHGSVSLEVRRQTEEALKDGRLRAVVATASLELGIDMGAVDLVCQVESPGNVARGLQRVGRAGHLVGQSSKGLLIPKTLPDLLNLAVLTAEMAAGRVEALCVPTNCLDILAQQIIAMTAMEDWPIDSLHRLIRQAYPYRDLTAAALDAVLEMITGRYRFRSLENAGATRMSPAHQMTALQPRISWDRIHQRLQALPGSQRLALVHGGTIPDTGQFAVYTLAGLRIGEVDEEFVYERRVGDTFLLGTSAWRIDRIDSDRLLVVPAEGMPALVPFWRGESTGRSHDLGLAQGKFLAELERRLDDPDCHDWLKRDHFLDDAAARNLRAFAKRQRSRVGALPTNRLLTIEASRDPLGDWQLILLSPFGRALHLSLRLALEHRLHARLGYRPQCVHHDDGILIRLTESDEPVLDLFEGITSDNVRAMILDELADSALFALRFRQNAARALMMPRGAAGKRAPLWLQRLRGRDLLQVARQHPDFPIVAETFRECLHDHLELSHLQDLLNGIASGAIRVTTSRLDMPSPFAANLLFAFTAALMYQYDGVEADTDRTGAKLDQAFLDQLIGSDGRPLALDPRAIERVDRRLRGVGQPPRSKPEMAEWLRKIGDVFESELEGPMLGFLRELEMEGSVCAVELAGCTQPLRWILTEDAPLYHDAFPGADSPTDTSAASARHISAATILRRFLETHALIGLDDVLHRYPLDEHWARRQIEEWTQSGRLVLVSTAATEPLQWSAAENFDQMQRGTLSILRREVVTCPREQFVDYLLRWQHLHPETQALGDEQFQEMLQRLQACPLPTDLWEHAILPARCKNYTPRQLDALMGTGSWIWTIQADESLSRLSFLTRDTLPFLGPAPDGASMTADGEAIVQLLRGRGALFTTEIASQRSVTPGAARSTLWALLQRGLVTNDLFDLVRHPAPPRDDLVPALESRGELRAFLRGSRRRLEHTPPEGRWSLVAWGAPDPEEAAFFQARLLLDRYGIVARELAILCETPTPWRVLYEIYSRMELAGDVRRGYFVEGLSGAQFAYPEASQLLHDCAQPSHALAPAVLVHSLDPANPFGSGAPFELSHSRAFLRRAGNWLVIKAGRPILLIEHHGKRLTAPAGTTHDDLAQAVARLPDLLRHLPRRDVRSKLTVDTWNDQPVTGTPGKELLEQVGFVRDYLAMTLYAVWQSAAPVP